MIASRPLGSVSHSVAGYAGSQSGGCRRWGFALPRGMVRGALVRGADSESVADTNDAKQSTAFGMFKS